MNPESKLQDAAISLREAATLREITGLSVAPEQAEYVATNAQSIAEAYFHPEAWFRGIYAEDTAVGFVMLEDWSQVEGGKDEPISLWRFMIDQRYQGYGYGGVALQKVVDHVRATSSQDSFPTSIVPGTHSPEGFYLKFASNTRAKPMVGNRS